MSRKCSEWRGIRNKKTDKGASTSQHKVFAVFVHFRAFSFQCPSSIRIPCFLYFHCYATLCDGAKFKSEGLSPPSQFSTTNTLRMHPWLCDSVQDITFRALKQNQTACIATRVALCCVWICSSQLLRWHFYLLKNRVQTTMFLINRSTAYRLGLRIDPNWSCSRSITEGSVLLCGLI